MYPHNNKGYDFTMQQFIQYYGLLERLFRLKFHRSIDVSYIQCYFVFSINLGKVLDIMQVQTLSLYSGIDRDEVKKRGPSYYSKYFQFTRKQLLLQFQNHGKEKEESLSLFIAYTSSMHRFNPTFSTTIYRYYQKVINRTCHMIITGNARHMAIPPPSFCQ